MTLIRHPHCGFREAKPQWVLKLPLRHPYGGYAVTLDSRATPGNTVGDGNSPHRLETLSAMGTAPIAWDDGGGVWGRGELQT